ncbi:MAG: hypothetical protein LBU88_08970 [Treponema sp.]|jgi:hypothetical protein|nr:hypothetical protein [Treponema sp.]
MIGFLLQKTLYDFWDNMFKVVMLNLGFLLVAATPIFLPGLMEILGINSLPLEMALTGIGILACSIYLAAASYSMSSISDYSTFGFAKFFGSFKYTWKAGLVMGLFVFFLFIVATIILPFYLSIESGFGLILAAIVFWLTVFGIISFQFYFSVYTRLGGKIGKSFKKCMVISLDNSGFSFFLFIHNLIVILLPLVVPFLLFVIIIPGPAGIILYIDEALRLRLLKYDWLEANPGANRKKIPWEELLVEERERTGHRTFKNFIFPWKD